MFIRLSTKPLRPRRAMSLTIRRYIRLPLASKKGSPRFEWGDFTRLFTSFPSTCISYWITLFQLFRYGELDGGPAHAVSREKVHQLHFHWPFSEITNHMGWLAKIQPLTISSRYTGLQSSAGEENCSIQQAVHDIERWILYIDQSPFTGCLNGGRKLE